MGRNNYRSPINPTTIVTDFTRTVTSVQSQTSGGITNARVTGNINNAADGNGDPFNGPKEITIWLANYGPDYYATVTVNFANGSASYNSGWFQIPGSSVSSGNVRVTIDGVAKP